MRINLCTININFYFFRYSISYFTIFLIFLLLKFLFDSFFSIPNVCSIWYSSGEYGGIVNTIHFNLLFHNFTAFVLWMLAYSNITINLFWYVLFAILFLSSISNYLAKLINCSSFVVSLLIIKYASLFHWAAITLSLSVFGRTTLSASHPLFIHE